MSEESVECRKCGGRWIANSCETITYNCPWCTIWALRSYGAALQVKVDKLVAWVKGDGPLYLEGCQAQQVEDQLLAKLRALGLIEKEDGR